MMSNNISVMYIAGAGRSGTTLLSALIDTSPDCFSAGEATHLWYRGVVEDQLCSCNQPFSRCELWQEVIRAGFGDISYTDARHIEQARRRCISLATIPLWLLPRILQTSRFQSALHEYRQALTALYGAIHKITGKKLIVDSSKYPPEAFLLQQTPEIDLKLVHLIRNCSAIVYAWQKRMRLDEVYYRQEYMAVYNPAKTCTAWICFNVLFERMLKQLNRGGEDKGMAIRYEDLIESPTATLNSIADMFNISRATCAFDENNSTSLPINHMVSGNPVRLQSGDTVLSLDSEWEQNMRRSQRWMVRALAGWLQARYRYHS